MLKAAFRAAAHGNNHLNNRLAGAVMDMLAREDARRQRAAVADFVFGSLVAIYGWAIVLININ